MDIKEAKKIVKNISYFDAVNRNKIIPIDTFPSQKYFYIYIKNEKELQALQEYFSIYYIFPPQKTGLYYFGIDEDFISIDDEIEDFKRRIENYKNIKKEIQEKVFNF